MKTNFGKGIKISKYKNSKLYYKFVAMMKLKKFRDILFFASLLLFSFFGFAQEKLTWLNIEKTTISDKLLERKSSIERFETFALDLNAIRNQLTEVPKKIVNKEGSQIMEFPDFNGNLKKFKIKQTSVFHPDLAIKFPTIKTYAGQGVDDKSSTIHFTLNSLGLYAMILSPDKGTFYIDPYTENRKVYMVYRKKDMSSIRTFECLTESESIKKINKSFNKNANELKLRTFRLAMATTEEYSNYYVNAAGIGIGSSRNDSISAVLSAIAVTMTRVNAIYERDLALTMELVANNDQLISLETDPGDDPYTNNDGLAMLSENQTTVDNIIGHVNYDIGHVFSTGGGGVATLNSPCTTSKARGVTGSAAPVGDSFDIDFVAHEMGHQYGAHHTFNGTTSNCNGNRNNNTAVEPGSGSTIMAYAGICTPQNVQNNSDAYFHGISIQEMYDNITIGSSQCAVQTNFINNMNAPIANAGLDYVIPKSTPFVLKGEGTDADGDELIYCWEQIDNEVTLIDIPPSSTQIEGAVFRSLSPTKITGRYLPALSTVISGNISSTWQVVPDVSRELNFKLTVRDNAPGEGQTDSENMKVTVNDAAGPFIVTSQNVTGISWTEGSTETISWDVAGTDVNGINVSQVNILLSVDGGVTFPIILASNTANDGAELITVPGSSAPNVRVMVEAADNIFYAVNSESFSIGSFETTCTTYDSTDVPKPIPDNNTSGITSIINILDDFAISDVNVSIDITHTWLWDLQISLTSPSGAEVLVYDRSCGSSGEQRLNINAIFDDEATSVVCDNVIPAISDITKSHNLLSAFNGLSSFGDWTLKVVDNAPADLGILNNWSIELCETKQTVSIVDFSFEEFVIYPNPSKDIFTISLKPLISEDINITLYDIGGRILIQKKFTDLKTRFKEELNLKNLAAGVYILNVQQGPAKISKKMIKY